MTSTHSFQGLDSEAKPSSRVLKPPGGGSSSIFGGSEETSAPSRQHKMASNIFGSQAEPETASKRSNPPGGKPSGIFQEPSPVQAAPRTNLPGGKASGIFGNAKLPTSPKAHPNKPKDNINIFETAPPKDHTPVKAQVSPAKPQEAAKEQRVVVPDPALAAHEPHLGPLPRSHNRVLNPPGGKSSVTFY